MGKTEIRSWNVLCFCFLTFFVYFHKLRGYRANTNVGLCSLSPMTWEAKAWNHDIRVGKNLRDHVLSATLWQIRAQGGRAPYPGSHGGRAALIPRGRPRTNLQATERVLMNQMIFWDKCSFPLFCFILKLCHLFFHHPLIYIYTRNFI